MTKLTALDEHAKTNKLKQAYQLSQLRQHANLSQQALADKMGVSQANISKIEHGGDIQLSTLDRYITALGVNYQSMLP